MSKFTISIAISKISGARAALIGYLKSKAFQNSALRKAEQMKKQVDAIEEMFQSEVVRGATQSLFDSFTSPQSEICQLRPSMAQWCINNGYTDPFYHQGVWWAFPPNAVMAIRLEDVEAIAND